jgi:hypothetical protein
VPHKAFFLAPLALLLTGIASALPILYTDTTIASGTLGGVAFTNSVVTATLSGDTANVVAFGAEFLVGGPVQINVVDLGITANADDSLNPYLVSDPSFGAVGFGDALGNSLITTYSPAGLPGYDLQTAIGPVSGTSYSAGFTVTDQGTLFLTSVGDSTFTATISPEPTTGMLLLCLGLVGAGVFRRRRLS